VKNWVKYSKNRTLRTINKQIPTNYINLWWQPEIEWGFQPRSEIFASKFKECNQIRAIGRGGGEGQFWGKIKDYHKTEATTLTKEVNLRKTNDFNKKQHQQQIEFWWKFLLM
jgi:hypothetical protein